MHLSHIEFAKRLNPFNILKGVSVLWMGCIYLRMSLRDNKLRIIIARANCRRTYLQLVTLTSGLSMFCLDGKGVPPTATSLTMRGQMTLLFLMGDIIWGMLGIPAPCPFLFHIGVLVTISKNGSRENIGMHAFSSTCNRAFSWPTCRSQVHRLQRSCSIINTPSWGMP